MQKVANTCPYLSMHFAAKRSYFLVISPFKILIQHHFSYLSLNWKLYTVNIVQKIIAYKLSQELVFVKGKGRRSS